MLVFLYSKIQFEQIEGFAAANTTMHERTNF